MTDHCLRSRNFVNVIVAGKQPQAQWLSMDDAIKHCTVGVGIWSWASNDHDSTPDVVLACAGDVPTLETLGAVSLLREWMPTLKIRMVNVVDLMTCSRRASIRTGSPTRSSIRSLPRTSRSCSRITATRG